MRTALPIGLLFVISLILTSYVSLTVFEGVPHLEDEVAFLFQAKTYAGGHLFVSPPASPAFFDLPFLITEGGKWFGKYPPGYPLVLAIGVLIGQPWVINPLAASLTLVFVYLIGNTLYGKRTALLAVILALVSPFFLLQSGTLMSHPSTMLFLAVFAYWLLRISQQPNRGLALLAGSMLGIAFLSRQLTAIAMAIPFGIYALYSITRDRRQISTYLWVVVGCVPFAAALMAYNHFLTGSFFTSPYELYWTYDRIGFGPGAGPTLEGHSIEYAKLNTALNLDALRETLFGWPNGFSLFPLYFALIALLGRNLARLILRRTPFALTPAIRTADLWDLLLLGTIVCIIGAHMTYWAAGLMYGPRYYFEAMPAILLLSARGLIAAASSGKTLLQMFAPKHALYDLRSSIATTKSFALRLVTIIPFVCIFAAVVVLIAFNFTTYLPTQFAAYRGWYGIDGSAPRLTSTLDLHHAIVFIPDGDSWTDSAPLLMQNSPTLDSDTIYALDLGKAKNEALMSRYADYRALYWKDLAIQSGKGLTGTLPATSASLSTTQP
jgi:4-amino-4-deoxy-L-arabinose transferase-like glycosyltransferase